MFAKSIGLLSLAALAQARVITRQDCNKTADAAAAANVVFDGRIAANTTQADFDTENGPYGSEFVKGQNVSFSELVFLPAVEPSLFDQQVGAKPFEVTVDDRSIFAPGGSNPQVAVRRTELSPRDALVPNNATTTGIKTLHFSIRPSEERPLNVSHEYNLVFLERADFSNNIFMLRTGTLLGSNGTTKNDLVLVGNTGEGTKTLFTTPFTAGEWTNLAFQMDFNANTIQVFASTGNEALSQQTEPLANDMLGNGQLHFGVNKNPTNPGQDLLREGFQPSGIHEGVVYGGVWVEDTANSTVTLS